MSSSNLLRWILFVLAVQLVLAGLVSVTQGSGVQYRLDARDGVESLAFQMSVQRAMTRMTQTQIEGFNWAMSGLDTKTFSDRYGTNPAVREVIIGQVARFVDERRKRSALLEAKLQKTPELVEASLRSRQQALDLFRTYQPVVTRVKDENLEGGAERRRVREYRVLYRVLNPNGLQLKALPCRVEWWDGSASGKQFQDIDCLAQNRAPNGEFYLIIPTFLNVRGESVRIELAKCTASILRGCWGALPLAKDVLPELVELWRIREEIDFALGYQFSV